MQLYIYLAGVLSDHHPRSRCPAPTLVVGRGCPAVIALLTLYTRRIFQCLLPSSHETTLCTLCGLPSTVRQVSITQEVPSQPEIYRLSSTNGCASAASTGIEVALLTASHSHWWNNLFHLYRRVQIWGKVGARFRVRTLHIVRCTYYVPFGEQ